MSINTRVMSASPQKVWEVLSDGWLYPLWVVGATRMREVDEGWPAVGTKLHHSVGVWPVVIDDETTVLECEPEQRLKVRAAGWPAGEADVTILVEEHTDGTLVTIEEDAVAGPGLLVPKPARTPMLKWRNSEALRRLAYLTERR